MYKRQTYPENKEWNKKLNEIYSFQVTRGENVTQEQKERLVNVYKKYRNIRTVYDNGSESEVRKMAD